MADYNSLDDLIGTKEGMDVLVNNISHDDDTMTFAGVEWFTFLGTVMKNLYVSGNSWFGFGSNTAQLAVGNRDTKMWYFYRQEGTIFDYYNFLKIRWEGYSQYNSTSSDVALKYEIIILDNGVIMLYLVDLPTSTGYYGSSNIATSNGNKSYVLTGGEGTFVTFIPNEDKTDYDIRYEKYDLLPPFDERYLITDEDGKYYKVVEPETEEGEQTLEEIAVEELTPEVFLEYGLEDVPGSELLMQLKNPGILYWQDNKEVEILHLSMEVTALPFNQTVFTEDVSMTDETIIGVEKVEADCDENTLFGVSVDSGVTWLAYVNGKWGTLSEPQSGMSATAMADISTDAWSEIMTTGHYMFRFVLMEGGFLNSLVITYVN